MRAKCLGIYIVFPLVTGMMISLFFQAWEKYRFPIAYERGDRDRFSHILLDLVGMGTPGLQRRLPIPDDSLIFYSGLLSSRHRPACGLANLIADYFDVLSAIGTSASSAQ